MIRSIGVVIPARDEEALLGAALSAVLAARAGLVQAEPEWAEPGRVRVVLVLDACTDGSLEVARSFGSSIEVLEIDVAQVGRARRAGVELLLGRHDPAVGPSGPGATGHPDARRDLWICSTDADTVVPEHWLRDHLQAARDGAEVAVGRVVPRAADVGSALLATWRREHEGGGRHVYGANLGFRADAYRAVGGFPPLSVGEDVEFVRAAEQNGAAVLDLPFSVVQTSGRRDGRTPGGFAGYLRTLVD
ncbi:glycosyltransferase [Herbiconiux sp. CPCC 205763]|uniref:4,4'-diaponeurosporenoate glycosyltransferase n=1 Tax=Herbiconiux aconitum TaxID=2970913 RepID=A0ABT2GSF8_9MICO|nr:glycosyltransferase [Herbiconiux aconitum]MCS5719155.1 glycosyltransferase [Herbiconiux aconitum]